MLKLGQMTRKEHKGTGIPKNVAKKGRTIMKLTKGIKSRKR